MLKVYMVQNQDGQYYRAKGFGGFGDTWVGDITKARIYVNIRYARSAVTFFATNYPEFKPPTILEFELGTPKILDETVRIEKQKKKNLFRKENEEKRKLQREIDYLAEQLERNNKELFIKKRKLNSKGDK
jgi:hypothetical protein